LHDLDYAVVIGVNDYPHHKPLRGAIADAEAFATWLRDESRGGGLPPENVKLLVSKPSPPEPLQHQIDVALGEILEKVSPGRGRRLYFYFGGHGCSGDTADDIALCLAMWSPRFLRMALSSRLYKEVLVRSGAFSEVIFFLDCCRVWTARSSGAGPYFDVVIPAITAHEVRFYVACATEYLSPAYEAELDLAGGAGVEPRGVFTCALLRGLYGAAALDGGAVTASSLKNYLEVATPQIAKEKKGREQRADIYSNMTLADDPVFGRAAPGGRVRFNVRERAGEIVLYGPHLEVLKRRDAAEGAWEMNLPRGLYMLEETATGQRNLFDHARDKDVTDVDF
jgi:hypothetical protein